jgi:hypothetical protein
VLRRPSRQMAEVAVLRRPSRRMAEVAVLRRPSRRMAEVAVLFVEASISMEEWQRLRNGAKVQDK